MRLVGARTRRARRAGWLVLAVTALVAVASGCAQPADDPGASGEGGGLAPAAPQTSTPETSAPAPSTPNPVAPSPSATPPPAPAPGSPAATPSPSALRVGASGPEVRALQERLVALGFWLGEPDGGFGTLTRHAVVAFQKANGLEVDGIAGPRTRQALRSASRPAPRSEEGRVIEVDLDRQLLLVAVDGRVEEVLDTSTGAVPGTTPPGRYQVFRQVDGYDHGPLGTLYRPKYFYRGVAVHGYPDVPPYPDSHGCVRVTDAAMNWLWSSGNLPIGQPVWVY
jgi:peptidoglycan hydrolase-like protein with peptidoglycan-binding domain